MKRPSSNGIWSFTAPWRKACHNEYFEDAMHSIRGEMFMGVPPEGSGPPLDQLHALHRRVLEAVRNRDPESAMQSIADHNNFLDQFFVGTGET